jgi:hypothetical protein
MTDDAPTVTSARRVVGIDDNRIVVVNVVVRVCSACRTLLP